MNKIMITLNKIKENNPCKDVWEKVLKANGGVKADLDKSFEVSSILDSNGLSGTLWVIGNCVNDGCLISIKFALWCARQVKKNTDDDRVSCCIDGESSLEDLQAAESEAWSVARSAVGSAAEQEQIEKLRKMLDGEGDE